MFGPSEDTDNHEGKRGENRIKNSVGKSVSNRLSLEGTFWKRVG